MIILKDAYDVGHQVADDPLVWVVDDFVTAEERQHVLDLEEGEAAALSDSSPFGALGGDSVLAVAMVSLAAKHGLTLAVSGEAPETMTMGMLA